MQLRFNLGSCKTRQTLFIIPLSGFQWTTKRRSSEISERQLQGSSCRNLIATYSRELLRLRNTLTCKGIGEFPSRSDRRIVESSHDCLISGHTRAWQIPDYFHGEQYGTGCVESGTELLISCRGSKQATSQLETKVREGSLLCTRLDALPPSTLSSACPLFFHSVIIHS